MERASPTTIQCRSEVEQPSSEATGIKLTRPLKNQTPFSLRKPLPILSFLRIWKHPLFKGLFCWIGDYIGILSMCAVLAFSSCILPSNTVHMICMGDSVPSKIRFIKAPQRPANLKPTLYGPFTSGQLVKMRHFGTKMNFQQNCMTQLQQLATTRVVRSYHF